MGYIANIYLGLRTIIAANFPEVIANGQPIFEAEHASMIPFEKMNTPYCVLLIEAITSAPEWKVGNFVAQKTDVQIFYVTDTLGINSGLHTKLEALQDVLWNTSITGSKILDIPLISWSDSLEVNQILIAKNIPQRAGLITLSILVNTTC